jgi:hypothetical protein
VRVRVPPEGMVTDTLPRDTLRTGVPDTLSAPPHLPRIPLAGRAGWSEARWEWTRSELLQYQNLSLYELLRRVPGLVATRAGGTGSPSGMAAFGLAGGRTRLFRDGLEVEPLRLATPDLQEIGLVDIDRIVVERTLAGTRIHLRTVQLEDRRPFSDVEVATGNFGARFLRALFIRPAFGESVVSAAFDLSNFNGYGIDEPYGFTSGRLRWDRAIGGRSGVQLEYLQTGVSLESQAVPADFDRRELVFRGRTRIGERLHAEGFVGHTTHRPVQEIDPLTGRVVPEGPSTDTLDLSLSSTRVGVRSLLELGPSFAEAGGVVRFGGRRGHATPSLELTARAGLQPSRWLGAEGEVGMETTDGGTATRLQGTVRTGGLLGFTVFASVSAGDRWLALREDERVALPDTVDEAGNPVPRTARVSTFRDVRAPVGAVRLGGEWSWRGIHLAGAAIESNASTVVPFGGGFDRGLSDLPVDAVRGFEGRASLAVPGVFTGLTLDGWYAYWTDVGGRPYLPTEQAAGAATFTGIFREGQFEPYLRLEASYRGGSLAPDASRSVLVAMQPYTMLDFTLQLRIIDLRAFFLYENLLNDRTAMDVPGRLLPGPRTMYGIRWFFRN